MRTPAALGLATGAAAFGFVVGVYCTPVEPEPPIVEVVPAACRVRAEKVAAALEQATSHSHLAMLNWSEGRTAVARDELVKAYFAAGTAPGLWEYCR